MARLRRVIVAGVNIRVHPHTSDHYRLLLENAFALARPMQVRGDQHLLISSLQKAKIGEPVFGTLARYTEIDRDLPWFNTAKFEKAADSEMEQIHIPAPLKPNFVPFNFVLFPESHLLVFESYDGKQSLSPLMVRSFFSKIFESPEIKGEFGEVLLDIVADRSALEQIFELKQLKTLRIEVKKPNPDYFELDRDIEDRLGLMNGRKLAVEFEAEVGRSLVPDDQTRALATVALRNGVVEATGRNENGDSVSRSTIDTPLQETVRYDPDGITGSQAFIKAAYQLAQRVAAMLL